VAQSNEPANCFNRKYVSRDLRVFSRQNCKQKLASEMINN